MFGTNFTYDLLVSRTERDALLEDVGLEKVYDAIEDGLEVHNSLTEEVFGFYAEVRNAVRPDDYRYETYGENRVLDFEQVDEIGVVDAQKVAAGYTVGFAIDRHQLAVQWTNDFLEHATVEELLRDFTAARQGDQIQTRNNLLNAIFNPVNRVEVDRFHNHVGVNVKALVNADGLNIPEGPHGQVFDGATHNHYLANATLTEAAAINLVETVKEHYLSGDVRVFINKAQEATWRAFNEFYPYVLQGVHPRDDRDGAQGTERQMPLDDRAIGEFKGAEVWVKPWQPAHYAFCLISSANIRKVARIRRRRGGLYVVSQSEKFPLLARRLENNYGSGVLERTAGAILYSNGASYVAPTF